MAEREHETICTQRWDCVPEKTVRYFYVGQQVSIPQSEEAAQQPDTVRKRLERGVKVFWMSHFES